MLPLLGISIVTNFLIEFTKSKIKNYAANKLDEILNKIASRIFGKKIFGKKKTKEVIDSLNKEVIEVLKEYNIGIENIKTEIANIFSKVIDKIDALKEDFETFSVNLLRSLNQLSTRLSDKLSRDIETLRKSLIEEVSQINEEEINKLKVEFKEEISHLKDYLKAQFSVIIESQKRIEERQAEILEKVELILKKLDIPVSLHAQEEISKTSEFTISSEDANFLNKVSPEVAGAIRDIETLIQLGNYYLLSNEYRKAKNIFVKVLNISKNPTYRAIAYNNIGYLHMLLGNYDESVNHFYKSINEDPNYYIAYYNIGVIHLAQNNLEKAIYYFNKSIEKNPSFAYAHYNLGVIHQNIGNNLLAIQHYNNAVRFAPNFLMAWNNLAMAYASIGNVNQALAILNSLTQRAPTFAFAWYNIGIIYMNLGQMPIAYQYFRKAVSLDPNLRKNLASLGIHI